MNITRGLSNKWHNLRCNKNWWVCFFICIKKPDIHHVFDWVVKHSSHGLHFKHNCSTRMPTIGDGVRGGGGNVRHLKTIYWRPWNEIAITKMILIVNGDFWLHYHIISCRRYKLFHTLWLLSDVSTNPVQSILFQSIHNASL